MPSLWRWESDGEVLKPRVVHPILARWLDDDHHGGRASPVWLAPVAIDDTRPRPAHRRVPR
ncbi:hypothetical protein [Kutzneria buriramensis]|uniref:Uncharacterized protein n=1 Tax=Kutzneria buriramensis TaxID=1045776 RepID=A0A3E0HLW9_9PSEU|nr:hypothetical protein [Kutzneria buriramensis]REH47340.1 hypothetical protein BCF44_106505 [Kutzneria buriramensis]